MSEQREAGKALDEEVATRVMGLSLDIPREKALAIVGATFVQVTGRVFTVDYGDGDEFLPMPSGESLPGHPSDDNSNQRYFRYVAAKGIEAGGKRAEMIEREVAACRRPTPKYSTDIAAALTVIEKMGERGFHVRLTSPFMPGELYYAGFTRHGASGWNGRPDFEAGAPTPAHALCLAALAALSASDAMPDKPTGAQT